MFPYVCSYVLCSVLYCYVPVFLCFYHLVLVMYIMLERLHCFSFAILSNLNPVANPRGGGNLAVLLSGASIPMGRKGRVPSNILVGGNANDHVPPPPLLIRQIRLD